jgi:X-X-X-Leu-X-X-Gly heptad repeat protein
MGPDTIWIFIPLMALSIPILKIWSSHAQKIARIQAEATAQQAAEKAAQYSSGVQALEDRVRVLERIVTDRGYDVAAQIEALRDQRRVEDEGAGVPLAIAREETV